MKQLTPLLNTLREFFAQFPHLPNGVLKPFVPFLSWYMLLQGIAQLVGGFQHISVGMQTNHFYRMFSSLIDTNPLFFLIGGILTVIAGGLYLMAFPKLSQENTRGEGWQQWALAAAVLTLARLFETIFTGGSVVWSLLTLTVGWYFIFEFENVIGVKKASSKSSKPSAKRSKRKKSSKK